MSEQSQFEETLMTNIIVCKGLMGIYVYMFIKKEDHAGVPSRLH